MSVSGALLGAIEHGLARAGMAPSRFGREATGDPRLVFDLRKGRRARETTQRRVQCYLQMLQRESVQ